jgi:hypothetical protein
MGRIRLTQGPCAKNSVCALRSRGAELYAGSELSSCYAKHTPGSHSVIATTRTAVCKSPPRPLWAAIHRRSFECFHP